MDKCAHDGCPWPPRLGKATCFEHRFEGISSPGYTGGPPIVISGGSVTIEFDADDLPPEGKGKHANPGKSLRRITVKGDGVDFTSDFPTGQGVSIKIFYDNRNKGKP